MKNTMKRKTIAVIACAALMAVGYAGAVAESAPADMETISLDNGFSMTYDANAFSVYVNPDNSVIAEYQGDLKAGFSVYRFEGMDAEEYMKETAEQYGVDFECGACFGEDKDWYYITTEGEEDDMASISVEYARNNSDGIWSVGTYAFPCSDEALNTQLSDAMSFALDSMTFAD